MQGRSPYMWRGKARFNMADNAENAPKKDLPPAARRALAEAEARRKAALKAAEAQRPKELGGPKGEEPTRYGDWERGGRAVDF